MKRWLVIAALILILPVAAFAQPGRGLIQGAGSPNAVPDQYIVVLNPGVDLPSAAADLARAHRGTVREVYQKVLHGFAVNMPAQAAQALAHDPRVAYVEQDQVVHMDTTQTNPPSWGLDRVDQTDLPLDNSYTYNFDGTGVHAYIIDTGIRETHVDFGGRASRDHDSVGDGQNGNDCNGHGTHTAGTVGSATYGIAKNVRIHAVRVLDCNGSGTLTGVIDGMDWVAANHLSPAVANMSLGGGASASLDTSANNLVASGVFLAVAAGNSNADACNESPARAADVYTVGSTTQTDARSSFSNFGTCVEIFAPGSSITSTWNTSNTATNTISGTSMATPHVTGAAALLLDENPALTPAQVAQTLTNNATAGRLSGIGAGSPNLLLFTLNGGAPPPPPPPPPPPGGTIYSTDFESGAAGWTKTSGTTDLWHLDTACVSAFSGVTTLGFSSSACNYNVGRAVGTATSPVINLAGLSSASLTFKHFWQTESFSGGAFDVMKIQVSSNGSTWTTLKQIDSRNANPSGYVTETFDVSGFATSSFQVRFQFDSIDSSFNNFLGWYVDDIAVSGN